MCPGPRQTLSQKVPDQESVPSFPYFRALRTIEQTLAKRSRLSMRTLDGESVGQNGGVTSELSELKIKVDYLMKKQVAASVKTEFGDSFDTRSLLAKSVTALGKLLPRELLPEYGEVDLLHEESLFSDALAKKLLEEGFFSQLISNIQTNVQVLLLLCVLPVVCLACL